MLYTINEVSNLLNLSKGSIYKKLKLKELDGHISRKQGIIYIDEIGFNLIKDKTTANTLNFKDLNNKEIDYLFDDEIAVDKEDLSAKTEYINHLVAENQRLWSELKEKNLQLNTKDKLLENMQVLLKDRPKQELLLQEQHFKELDNKLIQAREKMQERKIQQEQKIQQEKKGFLSKIFNK